MAINCGKFTMIGYMDTDVCTANVSPKHLINYYNTRRSVELKKFFKMKKVFFKMKQIVKLFVAVSLLLSGFIILNPITTWFIGLIAPKWLASKFFDENQSKNLLIEGFFIALQWQFWIQKLLPWSKRKFFVEENFLEASKKDRIHLSLEKPALFFSLSPTEKDDTFKRGTRENQFYWARHSDNLSDIMVRKICAFSTEEITKILKGKTIFLSQFQIMLEYPLDFPAILGNKTIQDCHILEMAKKTLHEKSLCRILENQGIGSSNEAELLQICSQNAQIEAVLEALKVRRQKTLMSNGCKDIGTFRSLCEEGLCIEAQKKMKFWQYSIFHNNGGKLSSEAILHFIQTENEAISRRILEYKEPALDDEFVQQMIFGSDKLFSFFTKIKNEQTHSTKKADV